MASGVPLRRIQLGRKRKSLRRRGLIFACVVAHTSHTSDFVLYRQKSGIGHEETNGGDGVSGDKGSSVPDCAVSPSVVEAAIY